MYTSGGAVAACLVRPPPEVEAADFNTAAGKEVWVSWLGPNTMKVIVGGQDILLHCFLFEVLSPRLALSNALVEYETMSRG
jgi:hypothetical protein